MAAFPLSKQEERIKDERVKDEGRAFFNLIGHYCAIVSHVC
jgi:hypothetical protein